jgi:hypothetical protein
LWISVVDRTEPIDVSVQASAVRRSPRLHSSSGSSRTAELDNDSISLGDAKTKEEKKSKKKRKADDDEVRTQVANDLAHSISLSRTLHVVRLIATS